MTSAIGGYGIDVSRDLMDIEPCERKLYPSIVKKQSPKVKKAIAVGLVISSLALTSGICFLNPNGSEEISYEKFQGIEQVIESPNSNYDSGLNMKEVKLK